ncbi:hypothetical protein L211DRAFT_833882 [Terfezia boudieri ATCC MYA-4762]|uniref:Uncharacterized protein n=1 Tax=Terfezia boudieri ATCC MYA-4762 TaxID=1051890 RepID=A0A3N4LYB0_9PEZI|nr:hypothetical protein L211DRAFT_833882 [Terfezia boudieri ATCC MYA-4762]
MPVQVTDAPIYTSSVYHGGRGGVGNYRRVSPFELTTRSAPSTTPTVPSTTSKLFFGGRGGAGNVHPSTERAMFSFDEELERDRLIHEHHAPVYSIGRGGKGNLVSRDDIATRSFYSDQISPSSSPRSSTSSTGPISFSAASLKSGADRLWDRVRRA